MPTPSKRPGRKPFPPWIRRQIPACGAFARTRSILEDLHLDTVCRGAGCPNQAQCFARGTATFLILGPRCTRACRFCSIESGPPAPPEPDEPMRVAEAVRRMGLKHAVVTTVTRDDLPDGGAAHFAATVLAVREKTPEVTVEVLTSDFQGDENAIGAVIASRPRVYNHNVETVPALYPAVRPQADYERSLALLRFVKNRAPGVWTKSGLMLGLGESPDAVEAVLKDLREAGCDLLTMGQYLQPSDACVPVARYVPPEAFDAWGERARALGFRAVASGPFVRSSYRAEAMLDAGGDPDS
jgi:lipoic acid synthetase